jgi:peptidoglycan/LPS O-acetylase OafA/YrhL
MSGFLIAKSWSDDPRLPAFLTKRALRLLPALIVAVTLTAFVLGPLVTTLPLESYLSNFSPYKYVATNSVLFTVSGQLPGVFTDNVVPNAVNGSLWTLPLEATAYVATAILGLTIGLRRPGALIALFLLLLVPLSPIISVESLTGLAIRTTVNISFATLLSPFATFCGGMIIWTLRDRLPLKGWVVLALLALWVLTWGTGWSLVGTVLFIPYAIIYAAFRLPASIGQRVDRMGDLSYGIYIYAYPVQQLAQWASGQQLTAASMFLLSVPTACALALLSWHLIEKRALKLKKRWASYPSPEPSQDEVALKSAEPVAS